MINMLIRAPVARMDVTDVLIESGFPATTTNSVVMPGSSEQGGKHIIHCEVDGSFDEIEKVCNDNNWEIYAAQNTHKTSNPNWNPRDEESEPMILIVQVPMKSQTWAHLMDKPDGRGGFTPQTQVHHTQGHQHFPDRPGPGGS